MHLDPISGKSRNNKIWTENDKTSNGVESNDEWNRGDLHSLLVVDSGAPGYDRGQKGVRRARLR
jgi:hypothetical protein